METIFNAGLAWSHYKQIRLAYCLAAAVAFLMSSYFVVGYLAGSLEFWRWGASEWLNGLAGIGITGVMTAYQFVLYASGDIAGGSKATLLAVCVAVGFSLLSEVGQGMERDHIRMEAKSQASPTYQALLGKLGQTETPAGHPFAYRLSEAQIKLARCRENVASGRWKDCIESEARLSSIQTQINQFYQQQQSNALALTDKAKQLEKDESNYHPLVNLVRSSFSISGGFASFLVSFLLIAFFEYAFHYLGGRLAAARSALLHKGYDVTRKTRQTPTLLQPETQRIGTDTDGTSTVTNHRTSTPDHTGLHGDSEPFYQTWKKEVSSQTLNPTVKPAKAWLKAQKLGDSDQDRQTIANQWLERLEQEGGIIKNPQSGVGKAKYILRGAL